MFNSLRNLFGMKAQSLGPSNDAPKVQNVKAEPLATGQMVPLSAQMDEFKIHGGPVNEYYTPEKYLDGAEIPTFYQFQSNMVSDEDIKPGMIRILEVDKRLTLPTRTHIRFLCTGMDVLHSWNVPSLGIKTDCTPGRINKFHCFIQREGVFYGQCSELCGTLHGFMPIVVEAVSPEAYAAHAKKWYKE
eukprot:gnl/MRDRNA2_/MRDRNA2_73950_c0_seq1.p1 gnl/MRDRNA2_/MRDRNA2_73950_c0~~gnl/MRDRNA2_/MRDRNA2_73950_c0_seq1.p1  ORF type:complete len:188 (+),score=34.24 gnl/MRDRNA2_/MRDRNA2_73950_c0_seq1:85-648(+)